MEGRQRLVLPRVYATFTGRLTERQRLLAAWLYAGPAAKIGGLTALQLHGVRHLPPAGNQVHLLIPHRQRLRSVGFVRIHRTTRPDYRALNNGILRVCSTARATIDAAIMCQSLPAVRAMVASVVQDGFATMAQLRSELDHARRNGNGFARTALGEVSDGVRSAAEAALRTTLKRSRLLPPIRWNPSLLAPDGSRLPTPDAWTDEVGLAVEVDSREFHLSPADWERTLVRHNLLARHGAQVLHFPPSQVRRVPAQVLHTVEQTYLERRRAGVRATIKMVPRSAGPSRDQALEHHPHFGDLDSLLERDLPDLGRRGQPIPLPVAGSVPSVRAGSGWSSSRRPHSPPAR